MDRKEMINRLVNRKLASESKSKAFCVCMARNVCFAQVRQTGQTPPKK